MPITQVDKENGATRRVFFVINAGPREGRYYLERFAEADPGLDIPGAGWLLIRQARGDFFDPTKSESLFVAEETSWQAEEHVIEFAGLVGWRMARAVFRRFGFVSNPYRELVVLGGEKQRPALRLIEGGA